MKKAVRADELLSVLLQLRDQIHGKSIFCSKHEALYCDHCRYVDDYWGDILITIETGDFE